MVEASDPTYLYAIEWASKGWAVFPVCSPFDVGHEHNGKPCEGKDVGKRPLNPDGFKSATTRPNKIEAIFRYEWPIANIAATPPEGLVVLDEDDPRVKLDLPATLTFKTDRGFHYVYKDTRNCVPQTQPGSQLVQGYDTRVHGKGYIVLPPSKHRNGSTYSIFNDIEPVEFPYHLFTEDVFKHPAKKSTTVKGRKVSKGSLVDLLSMPFDSPDCGDNWCASVAGHLARKGFNEDEFEALLHVISRSLAEPFTESAISKKLGIYRTEKQKILNVSNESPGWLIEWPQAGYGTVLGTGDNIETVPWSDFKVKAKELVVYPDRQIWIVDFIKFDGEILEDQELPSEILASNAQLAKYLANRGMTLMAPRTDIRTGHGSRLLALMRSQQPKAVVAVDYFGWSLDEQAFITPTHLIRRDGIEERRTVLTKKDDDIRFGICSEDEAREALRTFMSFQAKECTYLMGAWLMSVLLKEQHDYQSPALVIEGIAGSAKSQMARVLCQLAGADRKGGKLTVPVARDQYSLSPNTIVWMDDVHLDDKLQELFRLACTSGEYKLMDMNAAHGTQKTVKLLASTLVTTEGLTWTNQKAIRDRFHVLNLPRLPEGAEGKASLERWNAFKRRFTKDLTTVAGTLVQLALQHAELCEQIDALAPDNTRMGQSLGVLRVGARVLSAILDDPEYIAVVDTALTGHYTDDQSSVIVRDVIPTVWRLNGFPECAGENGLFIPVFRDRVTGRFWVNAEKLHDAWNTRGGLSARDRELSTVGAISKELTACGASESKPQRSVGDRKSLRYREIPDRYSAMILSVSGVDAS